MDDTATRFERAKAIFSKAEEFSDPAERTLYLDATCGGDETLRAEIERLLTAAEEAGDFMATPAVAPLPAAEFEQPIAEGPGTVIGPYKLMEQIGEGGFGLVFVAEQLYPVRRQVGLKIIKPGMDTRQVIARFEAERQALALMDHPNIAKVFDAGATESGRPYFVMELVRGVPITQYCDEHNLTVRERLELFTTLCQAIQHAHQKGIIHRDVKPTNVLITLHDDRPVPKVIDFGVAKALNQQLTERTVYTQFAQMIGTPLYMSPEQAELNGLDVDTRSDIYSLGVVLYELLTGTTPFDSERLKQAALDEIRRIVREEDPPTPSARISSPSHRWQPRPDEAAAGDRESGDRLATTAAHRRIEPARLTKLVRGELDWIVMKALEKDRNRRYETANALAVDVEHYLSDEPVEACPPSALYRFGKFGRRNKAALTVAALVMCFLMLLGAGVAWTMHDRSARQARVTGQLEVILDEVSRLEQAEKWSEALVSARRAEPALAAGEAEPEIQERAREALTDMELVLQLEDIRARIGTVWNARKFDLAAQADQEYAAAFRQAGIDFDSLPTSEAAHRITARRAIAAALLPALDDWLAVRCMLKNVEVRGMDKDEPSIRRLLDVLRAADPDPWRQRVREAMAHRDQAAVADLVTSAELDRQPVATLTLLYSALWASDRGREQELLLREAVWKDPADYWINLRLGVNLVWQESRNVARDGMEFLRAAVALRPESAHAIMCLGIGYKRLGKYDQAIACFRKAIELNPSSSSSFGNLSDPLIRKGLYDEAIAALEQSIKLTSTAGAYADLSMIHSNCPDARLRNPRRATELAEKAVELEPQASNNWTALGIACYRQGQWQKARTAFDKSLQLGTDSLGGTFKWADAIDWFFLGMTNWQLGHKDQAGQCYQRALQEMEKGLTWQDDVEQLRRFQEEAEQLLEITAEKPTTNPPVEVR